MITQICVLQLRQTVFQFVQKELAPKAAQIDKENNFPDIRVCQSDTCLDVVSNVVGCGSLMIR